MTTDGAAAYPPALATALPPVAHETGKQVQQRRERDHRHRKGRLRPLRGLKTLAGPRVLCRAHAFLRNLRHGFCKLGGTLEAAPRRVTPAMLSGWDTLTADLLTW